MDIAIIGGGITGLTAGYTLSKQGHKVTIFERDTILGGLAHGFKEPGWNWSLEKAYHHLFTNDNAIISLMKELGLADKLIIKRPITANYIPSSVIPGLTRDPSSPNTRFRLVGRNDNRNIYQLDSPLHLLTFPFLNTIDKVRTACLLAFCKINPLWQPLEGIKAKDFFETVGGKRAWQILWGPLMEGKFGSLTDTVAASWLWARIKKRTPNLCYIEGGFQTLIDQLADVIGKHGGIIKTNTSIDSILKGKRGMYYVVWGKQKKLFDKILLTVPTPIATKLFPIIHNTYTKSLSYIPHLHAQTLILETKEPILKDVYWLNILDRTFPFLAVVAHTNFMDKKHYGNRHLTYFGNYLPQGHPYLSMTKEQLLITFTPFIKRLMNNSNLKIKNSNLKKKSLQFKVLSLHSFTGYYAQPVHQLHYSHLAPPLKTPLKGVYLANLDSIYPWDRGTNYAVELGEKATRYILR